MTATGSAPLTEADPPAAHLSILIDWENLKISLLQLNRTRPAVGVLVDHLRRYGHLTAGYAYADWTLPALAPDGDALWRAGIEPVLVHGRPAADGRPAKNGADIRMAVDAVDLCHRQPQVGTYALVTGDADLLHPLLYLRRHGKRTIVAGVTASLSACLAAAADIVLRYERDIAPAPPVVVAPADLERAVGWVRDLLADAAPAPVSWARIGAELRERHGFDPKVAFGMTLGCLMKTGEGVGAFELRSVAGNGYAVLAGAAHPRPAPAAA